MTTTAIITGDNVSSYENKAAQAANTWKSATGTDPYKVVISDVNGHLIFAIIDEDHDTIGGVDAEMNVTQF